MTMLIDDLLYEYDVGNKLLNVTDAESHPSGFNDGNKHTQTQKNDFEYDADGNLIKDRNKGITNITHNHLHQPQEIVVSKDTLFGSITYLYSANGDKLQKQVMENQVLQTIDYLDGFQYKDGKLDFIPTAEGYVKAVHTGETTEYHYVYNYTDHLGNIRLSYGRDPETNEVAILKESHYYPFGLEHQGYVGTHKTIGIGIGKVRLVPVRNYLDDSYRYTFGGKEEQPELGLNWIDHHARNYDATLGRWMNLDPLAEKMPSWSPYNYTFNNPMFFIDPDGREPFGSNPSTLERVRQGFTSFFSGLSQTVTQYFNDNGYDTSNVVKVTSVTNQERLINYSEGAYKMNEGIIGITKGSVQGVADVSKEGAEIVSEAASYTTIITAGISAPITIPLQKGADVVVGGAGLVSASVDFSDGNYEAAGNKVMEAGINAAFGITASKVSNVATRNISNSDGKEVQRNVMETVMGWYKKVTEKVVDKIEN